MNDNRIPDARLEPVIGALRQIKRLYRHEEGAWLVGGSTGLLLQGVALAAPPRDLDLYMDLEAVGALHQRLSLYATDEQAANESGMYRSVLSHYAIEGVKVELVGAFEVRSQGCCYQVEAEYLADAYPVHWTLPKHDEAPEGSRIVLLMPLVHELIFNVLRERPDRYEAIASACRSQGPDRLREHRSTLAALMGRNRFTEAVSRKLEMLLDDSLL
ncbi:hypothetical protein [Paenibacillus sp. YYML68]|uniref:hypothetical protein n=1 Tax=Paenibacillus sp. YYML68 TaxID=2909250 RepID=UPI002490FFD7|nr:hypothetical protein [Paenibacillus sp. YYML68]